MKAVRYPKDKKALKQRYVEALRKLKNKNGSNKLDSCQNKWRELRNTLDLKELPENIDDILTAEYSDLVKYYQYTKTKISKDDKPELEKVFSYSDFHEAIANFFMDEENGFNLCVCHYCGMACINKYTISSARKYKNHFDLDHVLPKSKCPIVALSLMNFVPSCSVCNERLKRTKVLGKGTPIEELSPTSDKFDFDNQVKFCLDSKSMVVTDCSPTQHSDNYELNMKVKKDVYKHYIDIFHLEERYKFHKREALFWLELKRRYTDSRLDMMAGVMQDSAYTKERIKAEIFQEFLDKRERCFEKLKKDILKFNNG